MEHFSYMTVGLCFALCFPLFVGFLDALGAFIYAIATLKLALILLAHTSFYYLFLSYAKALLLACIQLLVYCISSPLVILAVLLPGVLASPSATTMPFPNIKFHDFSKFVQQNFGPDISLATVLTILFSLVENPDLLNLHARQQIAVKPGEQGRIVTTWLSAFVTTLIEIRLPNTYTELFTEHESWPITLPKKVSVIGIKLDKLIKLLKFFPFKTSGCLWSGGK